MERLKEKKAKRFSFSLLNRNCPRLIIKTIDKDPYEVFPSEETDMGKKIHAIYADILKKDKKDWDFSRITDLIDVYGNPERVFRSIEGRFSTEQKIRNRIGGRIFTTVSDLLITRRGERDIIDSKTSFSHEILPSPREQLRYYALPFLRKGLRVKVGIHFARYALLEWVDIVQGLDDYTKIANHLMDNITKVERVIAGKPDPEPSNFECKYCCPYILSCPSSPELFITNEKQAQELAGEYIKLKARTKKMEEILKVWATSVGDIYLKDDKLGYTPSGKTVIDPEATLKYLTEHKIPLTDIFAPQAKKFKKLAKVHPDLANFAEIQYSPLWKVTKNDRKEEEMSSFIFSNKEQEKNKVKKAVEEIEKILTSVK